MNRRRTPRSRHNGYSMAEILMVLTIIGIATAIAAPRLDSSGRQASGAAQAAGITLVAAQRAAVARQHDVWVGVDVNARRLRIHFDANNDGEVNNGERLRYEPLGAGAVFGRAAAPAWGVLGTGDVKIAGRQDNLPAITFHRSGSASEEGGFYVTSARARAQGLSKHTHAVLVDRATGRPSWASYTGGQWKRDF